MKQGQKERNWCSIQANRTMDREGCQLPLQQPCSKLKTPLQLVSNTVIVLSETKSEKASLECDDGDYVYFQSQTILHKEISLGSDHMANSTQVHHYLQYMFQTQIFA
jgi:hypothetical protein